MAEEQDLFSVEIAAGGDSSVKKGGVRAARNSGAKGTESRFRISGRLKKEITGLIAVSSDQKESIEIKGMLIDFIRSIE